MRSGGTSGSTFAWASSPTFPEEPLALLTIADLAAYLRRSRRSIGADLSAGRIPVIRIPPAGLPRFRREDIDLWLAWGCPPAEEFWKRKTALVRSRT